MTKAEVGRAGELAAAEYLSGQGYRIIGRNVRFRTGEIDLIAMADDVLVFVEVKTRRGSGYGTAAEAVTPRKQQQLIRLAGLYLANNGGERGPCRFDVVTVQPDPAGGWTCAVIRDAFSAS